MLRTRTLAQWSSTQRPLGKRASGQRLQLATPAVTLKQNRRFCSLALQSSKITVQDLSTLMEQISAQFLVDSSVLDTGNSLSKAISRPDTHQVSAALISSTSRCERSQTERLRMIQRNHKALPSGSGHLGRLEKEVKGYRSLDTLMLGLPERALDA